MTDSPYCEKCGGCGYIGCCGIVDFLIKHVTGKTNCLNEGSFLSDILDAVEDFYGVTITEKQRKKSLE